MGITGSRATARVARFRYEVLQVWRKWLLRRRRAWRGSWDWFGQLLAAILCRYLRSVHSVCRRVAKG